MNDPLFLEIQHFRQPWLYSIGVFVIAATLFGARASVGHEKSLVALLGGVSLFVMGIFLLIWFSSLEVRVQTDGLHLRFFPFQIQTKHLHPDQIVSAEVRELSPLREYGGWGWRRGAESDAWLISGNRGVHLHFTDPGQRPLLLGSQRPEDLVSAILAMKNHSSPTPLGSSDLSNQGR